MDLILEQDGIKLIKKYDRYYLRFIGPTSEKLPCDLLIGENQAFDALHGKTKLYDLLRQEKRLVPLTMNYYVDAAIKDYLLYWVQWGKEKIETLANLLDKNPEIKKELYLTLMNEEFPENGINRSGKTAKDYYSESRITIADAYIRLMQS